MAGSIISREWLSFLQEIKPFTLTLQKVYHPVSAISSGIEQLSNQPFLSAARAYAARGWSVFPLERGKKPLTIPGLFTNGFHSATVDVAVINRLWRVRSSANIGVATGAKSRLVVIDVDHHSVEKNGFIWYEEARSRLPETLMAQSPSGGLHLFLEHPGASVYIKSGADVLALGVDVRADGGYIVAPPSQRADGKYTWLNDAPVAPLPEWLLEKLLASRTSDPRPEIKSQLLPAQTGDTGLGGEYWLERYLEEVVAGAPRNDTGLRLACQLRDATYTQEEAKTLMLVYVARVPERDHPYTEKEALASLAQAYSREAREPARAMPVMPSLPTQPEWPQPPSEEAFYGLAGEVVAAVEPHTEADRAALLADFLTRFGCAAFVPQEPDEIIGPHLLIGATPHLPRLYTCLCGPTGEGRKGESAAPDKILFAEAEKIAKREFGPDLGGDADAVSLVNPPTLNGLSSGEGLIQALRDAGQVKPARGESSSGDPGIDDKRMLVMEPELANLLNVMSRHGNTLSPLLREAWDGVPTLQIVTKNNPMKATGVHVCIIGHITKQELLKRLTELEAANGFGNRFMWIAVRRSKYLPFPEPLIPESDKVQRLARRLHEAVCAAKQVGQVKRDADADRLWAEMYRPLSTSRGESMFSALATRAAPMVMRLALIYALTDGASLIGERHLRAALALWKYSERTIQYIWGDDSGDEVTDTILRALRQTGSLSRTEISGLFGRNVQMTRIANALGSLAKRGLATSESQETGGRKAEVWRAL